jgi:hypothetical protein
MAITKGRNLVSLRTFRPLHELRWLEKAVGEADFLFHALHCALKSAIARSRVIAQRVEQSHLDSTLNTVNRRKRIPLRVTCVTYSI